MIILPCIIEGVSTRKDKTVKVVIGTQELDMRQAGEVFGLTGGYAYVAIKQEEFSPWEVKEMNDLKADLESAKTPSQRLRAILYVNYQQDPEGFKDFQSFYLHHMERVCIHYKSKLDG